MVLCLAGLSPGWGAAFPVELGTFLPSAGTAGHLRGQVRAPLTYRCFCIFPGQGSLTPGHLGSSCTRLLSGQAADCPLRRPAHLGILAHPTLAHPYTGYQGGPRA